MENRKVITIICGQILKVRIKYLCGSLTGCKITLILCVAFLLLPNDLKEFFYDCGKLAIQSTQKSGAYEKKVRVNESKVGRR